ncbi:NUDIX hydrolase [Hyphobacterium sp. HN65]|uniref:GDP-mannose pyrophosphatase n=1 Tax=Hyphobacterium lacteum TaxID=3116575 RepID=A0ABU7LTL9_9PROT|nr:NUDIX hydrolase [Hyphobacterium sp. HN65]MEE2527261.1 NUDIX hydrolase [Hyphobacterium sp. HN65]
MMDHKMKRAGWTVTSRETVFENPWLELNSYEGIRPDGKPGTYGVMSPKGYAILILPLFEDGTIMLVGQPRFALDNYSWEIPEGGSLKSDPPLDGAKRELKEETGLTAAYWQEILQAEVSNSLTDEVAFGYLATGLVEGEPEPEGTEIIETRRLHFLDALEWVMSGKIRDLSSVAMILKAHYMASNGRIDGPLAAAMLTRE